MVEFVSLPPVREVIRNELSVVFEPANHFGRVKIPEMPPAKNEAAYTFFSFLPCRVSMDRFIDDVLTLLDPGTKSSLERSSFSSVPVDVMRGRRYTHVNGYRQPCITSFGTLQED